MDEIINNNGDKTFEGVQAHRTVYSGIKVASEQKQQLENQPVSDFLEFKPDSQGNFNMRYKLPEKGLVNGEEVNIRENLNYFRRGLARCCMDEEGNIDFRRFDKFYDMYLADDTKLLASSKFAAICGVPPEKQTAFKSFMRNCSDIAYNDISGFNTMAFTMRQIQYSMSQLYKTASVDATKEKLLIDSYPDFQKSIDNMHKLAAMNPETETVIYNPLDCGKSALVNSCILKMVNDYRASKNLPVIKTPESDGCTNGNFTINISGNRPDDPERGFYNDFDDHGCFVVNAKLNGKDVILSMETTAPPTGKLLFNDPRGETAMGVYGNLDELKTFHKENSWHKIENIDAIESLKTVNGKAVTNVGNIKGSHVIDMKRCTAVNETSHTMDELGKRLSSRNVDNPFISSSKEFKAMKECFKRLVAAKTDEEKAKALTNLNTASQLYLDFKDPKGDPVKAAKLSDYAKKRLDFARDVLDYTSAAIRQSGGKLAVISEWKETGKLDKMQEKAAARKTPKREAKAPKPSKKDPEAVKTVGKSVKSK